MRGAQAAFFADWILVKASFDHLTERRFFSTPGLELSDEAASRLQQVTNASDAALATIALTTPLEPAQVHALRMGSVSPDGSSVSNGDVRYEIPSSGARFLRAHRLVRVFKDARPGDNFFSHSRDLEDLSLRGLKGRLNAVSRATGLLFAGHWTREAETSQGWIARYGISIQRLTRPQVH